MSDSRARVFEAKPIVLRNGERIRPEEFAPDSLEPMHDALDAIQAEVDEDTQPMPDPAKREAGW